MRRFNGMYDYTFDDPYLKSYTGQIVYKFEGTLTDLDKMAIFAFILGRS